MVWVNAVFPLAALARTGNPITGLRREEFVRRKRFRFLSTLFCTIRYSRSGDVVESSVVEHGFEVAVHRGEIRNPGSP